MNPETDNTNLNIQITRYLAGEASPQEIEDLLHWIEQSDENRRYFIRQQDIWSALNPVFDIEEIDMEKSERSIMFKPASRAMVSLLHSENLSNSVPVLRQQPSCPFSLSHCISLFNQEIANNS